MKNTPLLKLIGTTLAMAVGIGLLAGTATGLYLAVRATAGVFASLDRNVATVTAIGSVVALASAAIIARAITAAARRDRAVSTREEAAATYQLLLDFWASRMQLVGELSPELSERLSAIDRLVALYGDAAVLTAHTTLRDRMLRQPGLPLRMSDLLIAVRRDLGSDTPPGIAADLDRLLFPRADAAGVGEAVPA